MNNICCYKKIFIFANGRVFFIKYHDIMKKVILTLVFIFLCGFVNGIYSQGLFEGGVRAQDGASDGFFKTTYKEYRPEDLEWGKMPMLPGQHGYEYDYSAVPVGSGLLLLTTLGVGYIAFRKKD